MANRFWPFGRSSDSEKNAADDLALSVALGADFRTSPTEDNATPNLAQLADVVYNNAIVYSCVRELATSVSAIEFEAVVATSTGEYAEFEGPLGQLIRQPSANMDTTAFIETVTEQLIIYGNVYCFFERAGSGGGNARIASLRLLRPDLVTINPAGKGDEHVAGIKSYTYQVGSGSETVEIPAKDIAHLAYPNSTTGARVSTLYGLSHLHILRADAHLDSLTRKFSLNYMDRAGIPSGILKLQKRITSQEDVDTVRNRWKSSFSGRGGQWNTAILDADASYESLQALPKDLGVESLSFETVSRICGVLQIPPIIVGTNLGISKSTYSNYSQAQQSYVRETVSPLAKRIERWLNLRLVPNFSGSAIIKINTDNTDAFIESVDLKATRIRSLFVDGILTLNESRQELGYDPIGGGDIRRAPNSIFELREGATPPVAEISPPSAEKWIAVESGKALEPSADAQHPPIERNPEGPIPMPRSAELIREIRKDDESFVDDLNEKMIQHFRGMKNRIDGIIGRQLSDATIYTKEYPGMEIDRLIPPETGDQLSRTLEAVAAAVIASTYKNMAGSGILPVVSEVSEQNTFAQLAIQTAGADGSLINASSVSAINETLQFGLENGLTLKQIAEGGFLEDGTPYKGLRGTLADFQKNRAPMIARTEISKFSNYSSLAYYKDMGQEFVQIIDGDKFDETCASRNNTVVHINDSPSLAHPNCIMDFVPAMRRPESPDVGLMQPVAQIKTKETTE